jgi:uracil-DNA glycosylase family 4
MRAVSAEPSEQSAAARREALKEVFAQARVCTRCAELAATRKNVVFGAGNANAELMFIGEAPGASEDEQGIPFVGRAGKLLEKLLAEIDIKREDVFIGNTLKCRPPGNRDPLPVELENCHEYLLRQVELIEPTVICTLGNFSTKLLRGDPCGCIRSTTPRRRCTRRACSRRSARTSRASRTCSRWAPPSSRRRSRSWPTRRRQRRLSWRALARRSPKPTSWACSEALVQTSSDNSPAKQGFSRRGRKVLIRF